MTRINTTEIWERHGYRVERIEQAMGAPQRNIYGPDGTLLIEDAEYTQETKHCATSASSTDRGCSCDNMAGVYFSRAPFKVI
jgi:hypothetical protein